MLQHSANGYESAFEEENPRESLSRELSQKQIKKNKRPSRNSIEVESNKESYRNYRQYFCSLTAYDRHVSLINQYLLYHPNATSLLHRDVSKDKRDIDLIQENHQFLWDSETPQDTWGQKLAKKYYDKLFKEYCLCDLSRYKENKVGMRWRVEKEVVSGKGQFICGEKRCPEKENLRSWEMNFGYLEHGIKKNALIKLRLCHNCSYKLNYKQRRKEIIKTKKSKGVNLQSKSMKKKAQSELPRCMEEEPQSILENAQENSTEDNLWKGPSKSFEEKDREEEFEEYLENLFM